MDRIDPDFPVFVSAPEVARLLRVSRSTAYRLLTDGSIRSVVVGKRSRRAMTVDVVAYVQSQLDRQRVSRAG